MSKGIPILRLRLGAAVCALVLAITGLAAASPLAKAAVPGSPGEILYNKRTERGDFIYRLDPAAPGDGTGTAITPGSDGQLSPDGRHITYSSGGLMVADFGNGGVENSRLLVLGGQMPTWSPDGAFIAYVTASRNIAIIDIGGTNQRQLTASGSDVYPSWSPLGDRIAFTSTRSGGGQLFVVSAGGGPERLLADNAGASDWSPDGQRIAVTNNVNLAVLDAGTGAASTTVSALSLGLSSVNGPSWAPDGARIAFQGCCADFGQIYTVSAAGGGLTQLTKDSQDDGSVGSRFIANSSPHWVARPLVANAGDTHYLARAASVMLDGSTSIGVGALIFTWQFAPATDCPPGTPLRGTPMTGVTVSVVALCGLNVTLTVRDATGRSATDTTAIVVSDRSFTPISVKHDQQSATVKKPDPRTPTGFTYFAQPGVAGLNVNACSTTPGRSFLCPYLEFPYGPSNTRLNQGYTLARVNNPGGPFHDFSYVSTATLSVSRLALLNITLLPKGRAPKGAKVNFYNRNRAVGNDVDGFLTATSWHEGEGAPGRLGTGHTDALRAFLADGNDPNVALEQLFGPTQTAASDLADEKLTSIECGMNYATADPLPVIWVGPLQLWDPSSKQWLTSQSTVPGPGSDFVDCPQWDPDS